ncbi:MAG: hypothetical protein Q8O07_01015, partial [Chloroflexota bacterium]|nr:hypothetical protein [Chloroflexota bacterium]
SDRWADLMTQGILVDLDIGRPRIKTRLSPEDLGLVFDDSADAARQELLKLGDKLLLPASHVRALESLENQARQSLEQVSYKTIWGRFVPYTGYARWKEDDAGIQREYLTLGERIAAGREEWLPVLLAKYRQLAERIWEQLAASGSVAVSREAFATRFTTEIAVRIPTDEAIRKGFSYEMRLSYIPLPSQVAQDALEADRMDHEREAASARHQVEIAALQEREEQLHEMQRDYVAQLRQQKTEMIDGFMRDLLAQLMGLVHELSTNVAGSLDRNGRLVGRSSKQLETLFSRVQALNFFHDADLDREIEALRQQVHKPPKERSQMEIAANLERLREMSREVLAALGEDMPRVHKAIDLEATTAPAANAQRVRKAAETTTPSQMPAVTPKVRRAI